MIKPQEWEECICSCHDSPHLGCPSGGRCCFVCENCGVRVSIGTMLQHIQRCTSAPRLGCNNTGVYSMD
jgi:hypothetical protein